MMSAYTMSIWNISTRIVSGCSPKSCVTIIVSACSWTLLIFGGLRLQIFENMNQSTNTKLQIKIGNWNKFCVNVYKKIKLGTIKQNTRIDPAQKFIHPRYSSRTHPGVYRDYRYHPHTTLFSISKANQCAVCVPFKSFSGFYIIIIPPFSESSVKVPLLFTESCCCYFVSSHFEVWPSLDLGIDGAGFDLRSERKKKTPKSKPWQKI